MKIKGILSVLLVSTWIFNASAQKVPKCEEGFSVFEGQVKERKYDEALIDLPVLMDKCPKIDEGLYTLGETALRYKIDSTGDAEQLQGYIDMLLALYQKYDLHFPGNDNANAVKSAMLKKEFSLVSDKDVYKLLDAAFANNRQSFTDYNALQTYFALYLQQYESGNKGITQEQFIEKYGEVSGQVLYAQNKFATLQQDLLAKQETEPLTEEETQLLAGAAPAIDALGAVGENLGIMASKHFSCSKLETYYESLYEDKKTNAAWLESVVNIMFINKCYSSPVLHKTAVALHDISPTRQTAYNLGNVMLRGRDLKKAVSYFDEAASMEANPERKAGIYYEIASHLRNSDKAEAKRYALKAAEYNPKSGKPYLLLAEMYFTAGNDCAKTEFERKALGWLAIETAKKAEAVESKYKPTVAAVTENYEKALPTKKEAKEAKMRKGDKIFYGCWINESVIVPKL